MGNKSKPTKKKLKLKRTVAAVSGGFSMPSPGAISEFAKSFKDGFIDSVNATSDMITALSKNVSKGVSAISAIAESA